MLYDVGGHRVLYDVGHRVLYDAGGHRVLYDVGRH